MCGGNLYEDNVNEELAGVTLPKVRPMSKVVKDGVIFVQNTGFGFLLVIADTEVTFTKKEQQAAEYQGMYDGFTKDGHPILDLQDISDDAALALLNSQGLTKPRKGGTVRIG